MFHFTGLVAALSQCFPHTRGDVPTFLIIRLSITQFSPHTWGCSVPSSPVCGSTYVFPTHVGMFRVMRFYVDGSNSFPHTRGDVPFTGLVAALSQSFSPHTWGCSDWFTGSSSNKKVFPTHVGMFRKSLHAFVITHGFPHTRGDVPAPTRIRNATLSFSPHTWGCSGDVPLGGENAPVFPTHVGMFLGSMELLTILTGFPHTRGDVPDFFDYQAQYNTFSPHTWGCSAPSPGSRVRSVVFPTHVGMFRPFLNSAPYEVCFPHTRGDVPSCRLSFRLAFMFSPHTWGCSAPSPGSRVRSVVFPTHVGMFRGEGGRLQAVLRFPHTRGDVPAARGGLGALIEFSPHTWGCSDAATLAISMRAVFPTHVGMFRLFRLSGSVQYSFPHTRGDVPT